jgi:hypothetical protein
MVLTLGVASVPRVVKGILRTPVSQVMCDTLGMRTIAVCHRLMLCCWYKLVMHRLQGGRAAVNNCI